MEKIHILILEDDAEQAAMLSELLTPQYQVSGIASNYDEAVVLFQKNRPDLALLDIFIDGLREGIRVAEYINQHHPIPIVFLTNSKDKGSFTAAKKQRPYNYLLKPIDPFSLQFAIELALEKYTNQVGQLSTKEETALQLDNKLLIKKGNKLVKVAVQDIYYIESDDKYCYICTEDARFLVQKSLKSFSETLPEDFMSFHRKYVVNISKIQAISPADYTFELKNGSTLPVSQRHRKLLLETFTIIK